MSPSPPVRIETSPDAAHWTLRWAGLRFDLDLHAGVLVAPYFGPDTDAPPPLWPGWRAEEIRANAGSAALVALGPRARPVRWGRAHAEISAARLVLMLAAEDVSLDCEIVLEPDAASGMLRRRTTLRHVGPGEALEIGAATSLWAALPGAAREVHFLAGGWGAEAQARHLPGGAGVLQLESRSGKTGFEFQPWIAVTGEGASWIAELGWSGNWTLQAQLRADSATLSGGLNPWGLHHRLAPGESLALPDALLGCGPGDLDAATRRLHDWRRARRPDAERPIPVQFNTWYVCDETPDAARLAALIPRAAEIGCEVFVLDAGWYASACGDPDEGWYLRVGDWEVEQRRLPGGLGAVRAACAAAGMAFGLWCEPESVGPRARLRRDHPEWLHHPHGIAPPADGRALLHLGIPEAWEWARALLTRLVRESGAGWLKWDFNADLGPGGWAPGLPATLTGQDPLVAHVRGLYRLQDALRAAFPGLVLEMCASGGSRMDAEILAHAHTNWISDQPQAVAKLATHFGIQRAHPAVVCNDWMVDWPPRAYSGVEGIDRRGDLAFRLRVAMLGSFGLSAPIDRWSAEERALAARHVRLYRQRLRGLIHHGDQYLLTAAPPRDGHGDWAAMWFVARDGTRGALLAFRLEGDEIREFPLPGLRDGTRRLEGEDAALVGAGLRLHLAAPFSSALVFVTAGDKV